MSQIPLNELYRQGSLTRKYNGAHVSILNSIWRGNDRFEGFVERIPQKDRKFVHPALRELWFAGLVEPAPGQERIPEDRRRWLFNLPEHETALPAKKGGHAGHRPELDMIKRAYRDGLLSKDLAHAHHFVFRQIFRGNNNLRFLLGHPSRIEPVEVQHAFSELKRAKIIDPVPYQGPRAFDEDAAYRVRPEALELVAKLVRARSPKRKRRSKRN